MGRSSNLRPFIFANRSGSTGNDTISARAPYGKPFSYRPQFKLWLSTNHKPEIPEGSEAIRDRLRLIPFNQRFDVKKADKRLPQKLREELPGVLLWAVQGCVDWYRDGLGSAPAVEAATQAYRSETNVLEGSSPMSACSAQGPTSRGRVCSRRGSGGA